MSCFCFCACIPITVARSLIEIPALFSILFVTHYKYFFFFTYNFPRGNRVHVNEVLSGGSLTRGENQPASADER